MQQLLFIVSSLGSLSYFCRNLEFGLEGYRIILTCPLCIRQLCRSTCLGIVMLPFQQSSWNFPGREIML